MKIIFDFDDVIFDSHAFKQKIFSGLVSSGIPSDIIKDLYISHRSSFSPYTLYKDAVEKSGLKISDKSLRGAVNALVKDVDSYIDTRIVTLITTIGKEHCFVVTAGDKDFQKLKVEASLGGVVIPEHCFFVEYKKSEALQKICEQYPDEPVIFVDDKSRYMDEAHSLHIKNLHPVLYRHDGFEQLSQKIKELS
jgi:hypothetical protein